MDQRQTGGEWEFELKKVSVSDYDSGAYESHVLVVLKNPSSSWNIRIGVFKREGRYSMSRVFVTPYAHRRKDVADYNIRNQEEIKNLPREAKRAIRRAFPLAVLML